MKMKTDAANSLIAAQLEHNRCGVFLREVIRPGSNVSSSIKEDSMILWAKDNKGIPELASICADTGEAFIVFRPGEQSSLGIRVKNGRIAQVRARMLKGESLPNQQSMSVKGRLVYIVDGLPEAYDPKEVITYLSSQKRLVYSTGWCQESQVLAVESTCRSRPTHETIPQFCDG